MLSSIHPFGERSRNQRYGLTVTAHIAASAAGGAALGMTVGSLGAVLRAALNPSDAARAGFVFVIAALVFGIEATGRTHLLPTRRRQVDENWLQRYRGWVYGGGFGAELGFGVSTIITTGLVHVLLATLLAAETLLTSVAIGAVFGLVRGATVLATRRIDDPARLRELLGAIDQRRGTSRMLGLTGLALSAIVAIGGV